MRPNQQNRKPNRHQRRAERARTGAAEMLPAQTRPVDAKAVMKEMLRTMQAGLPGYDITIFISEKDKPRPRFNFATTMQPTGLVTMLGSWVQQQFPEAVAEPGEKNNQKNTPAPIAERNETA